MSIFRTNKIYSIVKTCCCGFGGFYQLTFITKIKSQSHLFYNVNIIFSKKIKLSLDSKEHNSTVM